VSPAELGGFKSDEYLAISPQGKVPALKCQETGLCIPESDTVSRFLLSEYEDYGPSFQPNNPISNTMARFHDIYLTSIQMCLYKPGPPFGSFGTRKDALEEYSKQLYVLADMMDPAAAGPYLCGAEVSLADATIFPSVVFAVHMFPKFDHGIEHPIPDKIESWFQTMKGTDPAFQKVYDEVRAGIFHVDSSKKNQRVYCLWTKRHHSPFLMCVGR
jgi:glutathione S-transferase